MISEGERNFLKTGFKEVLKLLENNGCEKVFIAKDISSNMEERLIKAANQKGVPVVFVETMKELGKLAGIDVGASSAAIINH